MHHTLSNVEKTTLKTLGDKLRRDIFIAEAALPKQIGRLMVELERRERLKSACWLARSDPMLLEHERWRRFLGNGRRCDLSRLRSL